MVAAAVVPVVVSCCVFELIDLRLLHPVIMIRNRLVKK
jgi:hypothetical protein